MMITRRKATWRSALRCWPFRAASMIAFALVWLGHGGWVAAQSSAGDAADGVSTGADTGSSGSEKAPGDADESPVGASSLSPAQRVLEGNRLLQQGELASALREYQQAKKAKPDALEIAFNEGLVHFQAGEYDEAREAFERATLSNDVELAENALYGLAACDHAEALAKKKPDEAISGLEKAMRQYHELLKSDRHNEDAREANRKAASMWRQLREIQQQQQQQNKDGDDKKEDKDNQDQQKPKQQQQDQQNKDQKDQQQNKDQQQGKDQQQNKDEQQSQDQQQSEQQQSEQQQEKDKQNAEQQKNKDKQQAKEADADAAKEHEAALREQAERELRRMLDRIRHRLKRREAPPQPAPLPVKKDW